MIIHGRAPVVKRARLDKTRAPMYNVFVIRIICIPRRYSRRAAHKEKAMDNIIEVKDLVKNYGSHRAVDGISFAVERGSLFAFLGVNGAGKSTTINILCSVLAKDGGSVTVDGRDPETDGDAVKRMTGVVFQGSMLDDRLTVKDNLRLRAGLYGLRGKALSARLADLSEMLTLGDIMPRRVCELSGGQRRRADIARALVHSPSLLYLDEPTTGLDPGTRLAIRELIGTLRRENAVTVFLTTHYMEEAEQADKVVIIGSGRIAANGTPAELKARYTGDTVLLHMPRSEALERALAAENLCFEYTGGSYAVKTGSSDRSMDFLSRYRGTADFEVRRGNMDDVFLAATGLTKEDFK